MKDYRKEYFDQKQEIRENKNCIEIMNKKYSNEDWFSHMMKVIWELYDNRGQGVEYDLDITNNYDDECWIPFDDLCEMLELFKERRKLKRRLWFIKWLIIRHYLYYNKDQNG